MPTPSPDWDLVTLKWAGTYLDGSPCNGSLTITYNGGVLLDDDPDVPVNIYPAALTVPITTTNIVIDGESRTVGYAEIPVPASNDPDIQGSGGTYSLTESLFKGGGRQNAAFVADINAPGGVIWLNKIIPTTPAPATPLSVVYYSDFQALTARVDALSAGSSVTKSSIGLGNVDNTSDANKPVSTATQAALDAKASTNAMTSAITAASTSDRARANHTGTQLASTISDFTEAAQDAAAAAIVAGTGLTATYNDAANTITIASTGAAVYAGALPTYTVIKPAGGVWPGGTASTWTRPTSDTSVVFILRGQAPFPTAVASGTGGPIIGIDEIKALD